MAPTRNVWYVVARDNDSGINHYVGTGLRHTLCGLYLSDVAERKKDSAVDCIACIALCPTDVAPKKEGWYGPHPFTE